MNALAEIQRQVMWNRLIAVVEEQAQTMIRTAFSYAFHDHARAIPGQQTCGRTRTGRINISAASGDDVTSASGDDITAARGDDITSACGDNITAGRGDDIAAIGRDQLSSARACEAGWKRVAAPLGNDVAPTSGDDICVPYSCF